MTDEKYVNTLTRVLIPTVLRLVEKIDPASPNEDPPTTINLEPNRENDSDDETEDCDKEPNAEENKQPNQTKSNPQWKLTLNRCFQNPP